MAEQRSPGSGLAVEEGEAVAARLGGLEQLAVVPGRSAAQSAASRGCTCAPRRSKAHVLIATLHVDVEQARAASARSSAWTFVSPTAIT